MFTITSDKTRIFVKETDDGKKKYRATIGHKNQDGTWTNRAMPVHFKNGVELADGTDIKILNAFPDHFEVKDGENERVVWYIFVSDFEIVA